MSFKKLSRIACGVLMGSLVVGAFYFTLVRSPVKQMFADVTNKNLVSINDSYRLADYKIDQTKWNAIMGSFPGYKSVYRGDSSRDSDNLAPEKSYLLNNNLLSRHESITAAANAVTVNKTAAELAQQESEASGDESSLTATEMSQTDLWMLVYKAAIGQIDSRPLFMPFANGQNDYVYVSGNVYENYYTELLNRGVLPKSAFNDTQGADFLKKYEEASKTNDTTKRAEWDPTLGIATATDGSKAFGSSYSLSMSYETAYTTSGEAFSQPVYKIVAKDAPSYFTDESITTLEAFSIIESVMRLTEKEMTEKEANIVTYKYGIQYLDGLTDSEKATVEYLIAKGVINFEDSSEFSNLYGNLTTSYAYTLLYRVANKEARYNFSAIQLTDAQAFWQEKGFGEETIDVVETTDVPEVETLTSSELKTIEKGADVTMSGEEDSSDTDTEDSDTTEDTEDSDDDQNYSLDDVLGFISDHWHNLVDSVFGKDVPQVYASTKKSTTSKSTFKVIKKFDAKSSYSYKGKSIKSLKAGDLSGEIAKISESKITNTTGTKKRKVTCITFKVKAKSYTSAVSYVDSNITVDASTTSKSTVTGLTQIKNVDTGEKITLIPASKLKESFSNISVIQDKVLLNTETGVEAVILPDAGYALVGNKVIVSSDLIEFDTDNEVYYNLEIITSLLSNAYLKSLSSKSWVYYCKSMIGETLVPVKSSTDTSVGKTYVAGFNVKEGGVNLKKTTMVKMDNVTRGISQLSRKFTMKNSSGKYVDTYVIVDWVYAVPEIEDLANLNLNTVSGKRSTLNDVNDIIYTRPSDSSPELQAWWDSNISISNSLCNFLYGTKGVNYVTSGFMAPSLTVLKGSGVTNNQISELFTKYSFQLSDVGRKYATASGSWYKSYFNGSKLTSDYLKGWNSQYRSYKKYTAKATTGGYYYSNAYFVTTSGAVYKNISQDNRMSYNRFRKELSCVSRNASLTTIGKGSTFKYKGQEWIYCGTTAKGYIKIMPNFDVGHFNDMTYATKITYQKKNMAVLSKGYKSKNSSVLGASLYKGMKSNLAKVYREYFSIRNVPDDYWQMKDLFGLSKSLTFTNPDTFYLYDDSVAKISDGAISKLGLVNLQTLGKSTTSAVPYVYLKTGNYSFVYSNSAKETTSDGITKGTFKMVKGKKATVLTVGNIYYSGVNQTVMDSIIAKDANVVNLNDLEDGQKVYIDDTLFVCKVVDGVKYFNSSPIRNKNVATSCKKGDKTLTKSKIKGMYAGQKINYSGRQFNLTAYMQTATVGPLTGQGKIKLGILYQSNKTLKVKTKKKSSTDMKTDATYLCVQLKFKDGLLAMPIDSDGNTYTLLYSGAAAGSVALDNIPFYGESLSYEKGGKQDLSLNTAAYRMSQFYRQVKTDFKEMMSSAFRGDVINLIWSIIFSIAGYLAIMAWVCYIVLTHRVGRKYLEIVTLPLKGIGRRGFDLIKLVTLGIYDIDSEPTLSRTILTSFVCFFIEYAILAWIAL